MFCPKCGIRNLVEAAVHLAAAPATDPLAQAALASASVTEHTTLNLESPGLASGESRGNRQVDSPSSAT